jgi:hypothetical protein
MTDSPLGPRSPHPSEYRFVLVGSFVAHAVTYRPARAVVRVFVRQGPETVDPEQRRGETAKFPSAATADDLRRDLWARYVIDDVFWGPKERDFGDFDPMRAGYFQRIYERQSYLLVGGLR